MSLYPSIVGICSECCDCPIPELYFYPRVTVACVSREGTASICGWSGYRPDGNVQANSDPTAPWQGKKWKTKTFAGSLDYFINSYAEGNPSFVSCGGDPTCDGGNSGARNDHWEFSGAIERTCAGITSNTAQQDFSQTGTGDNTCVMGTPIVSSISTIRSAGGSTFVNAIALTQITRSGQNCFDGYYTTGSATETLGDEDTFADALARVEPPITPGSSCCAYISSQAITSPESTAALSKTGRAVTLQISVEGAPSTTYTIRLRFSNANLSDPSEENDDTIEEIEVTTDEDGVAELEYDVEDPAVGYQRCFVRAETDSYQFKFRAPLVNGGECYKITWAERVYDPEVGMSVVSIPVASGGSGYTTAPDVTIAAPELEDGVQAEATAVIDTNPSSPTFGQVTAINVTVSGSGYIADSLDGLTSLLSVSIAPPEEGTTAQAGCAVLSGDTAKEWAWSGSVPEGYDPEDSSTWPVSPVFTVTLEEGMDWRIACVEAVCICDE